MEQRTEKLYASAPFGKNIDFEERIKKTKCCKQLQQLKKQH